MSYVDRQTLSVLAPIVTAALGRRVCVMVNATLEIAQARLCIGAIVTRR